MRNKEFRHFYTQLIRAGVAKKYAQRAAEEMYSHQLDLAEDLRSQGATAKQANQKAYDQLGNMNDLAQAFISRPELRSWENRHPCLLAGYQLASSTIEAPLTTALFLADHADVMWRWLLAIIGGLSFVFSLLFLLQLMIAIG